MHKDNVLNTQIEPLLDYFKAIIPLNKVEKNLLSKVFALDDIVEAHTMAEHNTANGKIVIKV